MTRNPVEFMKFSTNIGIFFMVTILSLPLITRTWLIVISSILAYSTGLWLFRNFLIMYVISTVKKLLHLNSYLMSPSVLCMRIRTEALIFTNNFSTTINLDLKASMNNNSKTLLFCTSYILVLTTWKLSMVFNLSETFHNGEHKIVVNYNI